MEWTPQEITVAISVVVSLGLGLATIIYQHRARIAQFRHDEKMQAERLTDSRAAAYRDSAFEKLDECYTLLTEARRLYSSVETKLGNAETDPVEKEVFETLRGARGMVWEVRHGLEAALDNAVWLARRLWEPNHRDIANQLAAVIRQMNEAVQPDISELFNLPSQFTFDDGPKTIERLHELAGELWKEHCKRASASFESYKEALRLWEQLSESMRER